MCVKGYRMNVCMYVVGLGVNNKQAKESNKCQKGKVNQLK